MNAFQVNELKGRCLNCLAGGMDNYTSVLCVGQYPIDVTLGDNPNYSVVSTNGILTVTPKVLL
jgi:hypothetical protein